MQNDREPMPASETKKSWQPPTLAYIGDVEDVVQGGLGKVSLTAADPGEPRKTQPSEP